MTFNWTRFEQHVSGIRNRLANERDDSLPRTISVDDLPRPKAKREADELSEHESQVAIFQWADLMVKIGRYPELELLFAVPNASHRRKGAAGRQKAEGMKKGVPDMFLPVPRGGAVGLVIELKADDRLPRPEQQWWLDKLAEQGWITAVCFSRDQAIETLVEYLTGKYRRKS